MQTKRIMHSYMLFIAKKLSLFKPYSGFIVILHCTTPGCTVCHIVDVNGAITVV